MIGQVDAVPMIAVKDLDRAKKFYRDTLGLTLVEEMGEEVATMKSGSTLIDVYRSDHAGTNEATALTFTVPDIEAEVNDLSAKGVSFEHYEMEGLSRQGDIFEAEGMRTAWFKDPDGNILSLFQKTDA